MIKILMIEDDLELAEILTEFLAKSDMDVKTARAFDAKCREIRPRDLRSHAAGT